MELFGAHIDKIYSKPTHSITKHLEIASKIFKAKVFSIFISSPRRRRITADASELAEFIDRTGIKIIAHSSYATGLTDDFMLEELEVCRQAKISGLVVHLPKQLINTSNVPSGVYLETPAVTKESHYHDAQHLNALFEMNRSLGICIDTAHLHTNGTRLTTSEDMHALLDGLNPDMLPHLMFHLNDSKRELGTGPDSHATFNEGKIWSRDKSGLQTLIRFIVKNKIPTILERKEYEGIVSDLEVIKSLM